MFHGIPGPSKPRLTALPRWNDRNLKFMFIFDATPYVHDQQSQADAQVENRSQT
jgi:hypothetical protein